MVLVQATGAGLSLNVLQVLTYYWWTWGINHVRSNSTLLPLLVIDFACQHPKRSACPLDCWRLLQLESCVHILAPISWLITFLSTRGDSKAFPWKRHHVTLFSREHGRLNLFREFVVRFENPGMVSDSPIVYVLRSRTMRKRSRLPSDYRPILEKGRKERDQARELGWVGDREWVR